jgi:hypothetical protein
VSRVLHSTLRLPDEATALLRSEAAGLKFVHHKSSNYGVKAEEARITSPFDMASTEGLGFCRELAESDLLNEAGVSLLGGQVGLSSCTYILYDSGSFIGLHTDRPGCEVNVLVLLAGGPTAAEFRPFRPDETVRDLLPLSRAGGGLVDDTMSIHLDDPGDAVIFRATELPHQRRQSPSPLLLLSICYGPQ